MLTVAQIGQLMVGRLNQTMSRAGLSVTTPPNVANPDVNDALSQALEYVGLPPADESKVVDDDLARIVAGNGSRKFKDLVEIFVLETCQTRVLMMPVTQSWEDYKISRQGVLDAIQALIAAKWTRFQDQYQQNQGPVVGRMSTLTRHPLRTEQYWWRNPTEDVR